MISSGFIHLLKKKLCLLGIPVFLQYLCSTGLFFSVNAYAGIQENISPESFVLFNEFGDNALIFNAYFWISMGRLMERRIIESDIRFRIEQLFATAGIVIAFPQQDTHLYTSRPFELKMLKIDEDKL